MSNQSVRSQIQKWLDQEVSDSNFLDLLKDSLDQIRLELEDGEEPDTVDLSDHDDLHALFWKALGITFEFLGFEGVESDSDSISFFTVPNELSDLIFDSEEFIQAKVFGPDLELLKQYAGMIIARDQSVNYRVISEAANFLEHVRYLISNHLNTRAYKLNDSNTSYTAEAFFQIVKFLGFKDLQIEYKVDDNRPSHYLVTYEFIPGEIALPVILNTIEYLKQNLDLREKESTN